MGVFLFFAAAMAALAGTTLLWRGTPLDCLWALNPRAHAGLSALGRWVGIPFLALSAALLAAGIGWFRRRAWGWRMATGIVALQVAGDVVNIFRGDFLRGGAGVAIAGALLAWLASAGIRGVFRYVSPRGRGCKY